MSPLPHKTALISIATALIVFVIAISLEDDSRWRPPESERLQLNPGRPTGQDRPLETTSPARNCEQSEQDLQRLLGQARYCRVDEDCTLFDYGYPVQCLTSVAKSEITNLRLEFRRYENSCDFRVYYDCPTGEFDRVAVCRDNQCTVELETVDELQEETLEHIGADR